MFVTEQHFRIANYDEESLGTGDGNVESLQKDGESF